MSPDPSLPHPGTNSLHVVAVRTHRHRAPLRRPFITAARRTE